MSAIHSNHLTASGSGSGSRPSTNTTGGGGGGVTTTCQECGGTVIEYDTAAGNGFCVSCGTVVEENTIVSEVTFGEASSGAAIVQGSFVGSGSTHARMSGPFGTRTTSESREQTIEKATKNIQNVAHRMRLSEVVQTAAIRMYTLALEHKFTKGRKNMNVIAVCLYIACRQKETRNYMLIDFSDLLQVNVFELGHTYLQLLQTLNLRLPLIDPSHYISRFASLLEFGPLTPKVTQDAIRLVQRFSRDWLSRGRRPSGICGAALLLAARMNNFRRSVQEVVQVVKIAEGTVKKRVEEFRGTGSGGMTIGDFRTVWLEEEGEPPAFRKGREKERREKEEREKREREMSGEGVEEGVDGGEEGSGSGSGGGKRKRKDKENGKRKRRKKGESSGDEVDTEDREKEEGQGVGMKMGVEVDIDMNVDEDAGHRLPIDPRLLNEGILAGVGIDGGGEVPLFLPDDSSRREVDLSLISNLNSNPDSVLKEGDVDAISDLKERTKERGEEIEDEALEKEVIEYLHNEQGSRIVEALDEVDERRREGMRMFKKKDKMNQRATVESEEATERSSQVDSGKTKGDEGEQESRRENRDGGEGGERESREDNKMEGDEGDEDEDDELEGLDENELDQFILSEEEVRIKERVWVEINRDYLEAIAMKEALKDGLVSNNKSRKRRKNNTKPRDMTTPSGNTAIESVQSMIRKSAKYSKRINYDAIKKLFDGDSGGTGVALGVGGVGFGGGGRGRSGSVSTPTPNRGMSLPRVNLDEKEEYMYTIEDEKGVGIMDMEDGEGVVVVEEGGGGVGGIGMKERGGGDGEGDGEGDEDADGEFEVDGEEVVEGEGKGVEDEEDGDGYWDDGYEQEV